MLHHITWDNAVHSQTVTVALSTTIHSYLYVLTSTIYHHLLNADKLSRHHGNKEALRQTHSSGVINDVLGFTVINSTVCMRYDEVMCFIVVDILCHVNIHAYGHYMQTQIETVRPRRPGASIPPNTLEQVPPPLPLLSPFPSLPSLPLPLEVGPPYCG